MIYYLAVDEDGSETAFTAVPFVAGRMFNNEPGTWDTHSAFIPLPLGTIEKLIGKKITFNDQPQKYEGKLPQ